MRIVITVEFLVFIGIIILTLGIFMERIFLWWMNRKRRKLIFKTRK